MQIGVFLLFIFSNKLKFRKGYDSFFLEKGFIINDNNNIRSRKENNIVTCLSLCEVADPGPPEMVTTGNSRF